MPVDIDRIRRHIETVAGFTATPGAGSTRLSYSSQYRQACDYLIDHARELGLRARLDAIGNLRVRLDGGDPAAPALVVGSHLDTVIHGGDFDGVLGVVAGIEVLQILAGSGSRPPHPVEVIAFVEEEGTTFRSPLAGSKALTGELEVDDLRSLKADDGASLYQRARMFGLDPDTLERDRLRPEAVKAMLELHIEQGAVLESMGIPVGIVGHIAGSENHRIRLRGRANHAGTTPMSLRFDALACAAECIAAVERIASQPSRPQTVATVGRIRCTPNAANVIPGAVELSLDVRDVEQSAIESAARCILDAIAAIAKRRHIGFESERTGRSPPQPMAPAIVERLTALAERAGIRHHHMASGALHDALVMARVTPTGMIFVPSRDGRSHSPSEWTDYEDITVGAELLLAAVTDLAAV